MTAIPARFKRIVIGAFLLAILAGGSAPLFQKNLAQFKESGLFIRDFAAYWGAVHLILQGQNPYDAKNFLKLKQSIGYDRPQERHYVCWYFPWTYALFFLFWVWPLGTAAHLWLLINLGFPAGIGFLTFRTFFPQLNVRPLALLLSSLCLLPYLYLLQVGQISFWVALGVIGMVYSIKRGRDIEAGLFLVLTTIKPHTVFLVYMMLLLWGIRRRRWKILASFLTALGLLSLAATLLRPALFWERFGGYLPPEDYASATLETFVRLMIHHFSGALPRWPAVAIPALFALGALLYFWRRPVNWERDLPPALCLSLIGMPYGGLNDFNLLAIVQVMILGSFREKAPAMLWPFAGILLLFHLLTLWVYAAFDPPLHTYAWYPWFFLGFWFWSSHVLPKGALTCSAPKP